MNRLKKIILSFALPFFCLLISVSYAEFDLGIQYTCTMIDVVNVSTTQVIPGYSTATIYTIGYQYLKNGSSTYESTYKQLLQDIVNAGYDYVTLSTGDIFILRNADFGLNSNKYFYVTNKSEGDYTIYNPANENNRAYYYTGTTPYYRNLTSITIVDSTISVKNLLDFGRGVTRWDGEYYYEAPITPDTPSLPSNAEIAQVVQAFYDSDLYKNNTNFKDFMVVYSFITGYYSIIGTDNHLLQEIYYDGAKPSNDDFTYPDTWWRFYNYFGNAQNLFYGWDYWLYSTYKENDVFTPISYDGVGKINDLFKLKFTNQSIIVYSSYEYKVYEFRPPTEEGGENQVTDTTVPGDEYTYNENLDPTDSNYSPIQNYIPTNPSQSILGDVDFDEINKTFEENKDILNIEGASWLFTANNKFVGYFIGFLSLLIVFLIISRILGG